MLGYCQSINLLQKKIKRPKTVFLLDGYILTLLYLLTSFPKFNDFAILNIFFIN